MPVQLPIASETLALLCRRYRIRRLSLFGSRLLGYARPDSDVDLLVEFEPETIVTLLDMTQIELELSALLDGQTVNLRTASDLSPCFRADVVRAAEPQYVAA